MLNRKRTYPKDYIQIDTLDLAQSNHFPFQLFAYGYSNQKKFAVNNEYKYSDILLVFTISGVARLSTVRHTKYLNANDLYISACNSPITIKSVGAEKWQYIYIVIGGAYSKFYYNLIRDKSNVYRVNPLDNIIDHMLEPAGILYDGSNYSHMKSNTVIQNILMELYEIAENVSKSRKVIPVQENSINTALNYIARHYQEDLTLDAVCNKMAFSKYYFCKLFKEHTGVTLHQYITEYRVNKSKELLSYSKLPINAIAAKVGFQSHLTYIRCFKKSMQMTPSEYRQNF